MSERTVVELEPQEYAEKLAQVTSHAHFGGPGAMDALHGMGSPLIVDEAKGVTYALKVARR